MQIRFRRPCRKRRSQTLRRRCDRISHRDAQWTISFGIPALLFAASGDNPSAAVTVQWNDISGLAVDSRSGSVDQATESQILSWIGIPASQTAVFSTRQCSKVRSGRMLIELSLP